MDLSQYENIWLGGDICAQSSRKEETLDYIDGLFDVGKEGNHWALGNHDVTTKRYDWIKERTKRPDFYSEYNDGMTVMVLNANWYEPECEKLEEQYTMFENVCDTIQKSSHLVLLSHHIIWSDIEGMPSMWEKANANKPFWESKCGTPETSRFQDILYDQLVEVQKRGVQVVFISGDYGQKDKFFEEQTDDGVWFLASGIDRHNRHFSDSLKSIVKDKVLHLQHNSEERSLSWEFLDLDSLSEVSVKR